jgi:hypothetical protein
MIKTWPLATLTALFVASFSSLAGADNEAVSFKKDLVPILKTRCAVCHLTGQEAGRMALHPRAAYSNLVNIESVEVASMKRVLPYQPEASYLMHKLLGSHLDVGGTGTQMPFGSQPLSSGEIASFKKWISEGAAEN